MKKYILVIISVFTIFTSCVQKSEIIQNKISGAWDCTSVEINYYSAGEVDSSKTLTDCGYWLLYDYGDFYENAMTYDHSQTPPTLAYLLNVPNYSKSAGTAELQWYRQDKDRFTLWFDISGTTTNDRYVIYTILKQTSRKITLQYVSNDTSSTGNYSYKEIITLKKAKD